MTDDSARAREARQLVANILRTPTLIGSEMIAIRALDAAEARGRVAGRLDGIEEAARWHDKIASSWAGALDATGLSIRAEHTYSSSKLRALAEKGPGRQDMPAPERDGWRPITKELKGGPYLVTNNVTAVNAHGVMSHVWVGHIIKASNPELTGKYVTYDQSDRLIHNLTHYMPLPAPPRGTPR